MTNSVPRRRFLKTTVATAAGAAMAAQVKAASSPNERVVIGIMGLERGHALAKQFAQVKDVHIKYLCDVDTDRAGRSVTDIKKRGQTSQAIGDFRRILDDKEVDALVCAAPNHWHGPATILGCAAGKHVYVEKPCSHNPAEGEMMIRAARQSKKCVQMGTQRRSSPTVIQAIGRLHDGAIGRVYSSQCSYSSLRGSIGKGNQVSVPSHIDYELWQGPAPRRPYYDNVVHYNWHWRWHWGNGELGNNGTHALDLARWGLNVDYPSRVVSSGSRYRYDDDQETPDTHLVAFEFEDQGQITWRGLSHNKHYFPFVSFFGEQGTMEMGIMGEYTIFDANEREIEKVEAPVLWGRTEHVQNFVDAVRSDDPEMLNQEIESAHKSTMLSHLGNIAHRTGRTIGVAPSTGHIVDDTLAKSEFWGREYEHSWEPKV
jgi:predicted dehydrogenase